jgi:hypothetical protein
VSFVFLFGFFFSIPHARAQTIVSARPDAVTVTLYREEGLTSRDLQEDPDAASSGLVMVTETRTVDVPAGGGRIAFRGVADGMIPETAAVTGIEVAEQNFDYDLLTPGALAARSVGETVRLVRTNPATGAVTDEAAVIRSAPEGVVLDVGGRVEALDCSGLPERLVFERVPEGLADRPTLSVRTRPGAGGRRTIRLSYLATGLAWSADYVAKLNPDGRTMDLTGWLTLANSGDTTFGQAPTDVVAGTLNREQVEIVEATRIAREQRCWPRRGSWGTRPPPPPPPPAAAPMEMAGEVEEIIVTGSRREEQLQDSPTSIATLTELGDYKLYTLPEPTTVAAHQVKQVRFLDQRRVPVQRIYELRLDAEPGEGKLSFPDILLRAANTREAGLGEPLPAGNVVVMEPGRSGGLFYVGEDQTSDIPEGLPVEFRVGEATDVAVQQTLTDESERRGDWTRRAYELMLTNAKTVPARLELRLEPLDGLRVVRSDVRHTTKDGAPLWTLTLRPGERRTFRYTIESED